MTSRFDVERAVLRSGLPPGWRHLMHVLCTKVDQDAGVILPDFQPSLTRLARDTGMHRRTVMRHLKGLEGLGWVTRRRPALQAQRAQHARTSYALHIGTGSPQASDTVPPGLGAAGALGLGAGGAPELGASRPKARDTTPRNSSMSSRSTEDEIESIIKAIRDRSGASVDREWAQRVRDQVLGARDNIRDPAAYCRRVIMGAPPETYRPTPTPPRFTKARGFE